MPGSAPRRSSIDRFDASVEEGTFGGYEAFGVYSEDAGSGRSSEYEIFIVSTGAEFRSRCSDRQKGSPSRPFSITIAT